MENELKEIIFKQFDSYYKAIPKRGFNNVDWTGYPTLHKRCENLYWKRFYLPPQLLLSSKLTHEDFNELKKKGFEFGRARFEGKQEPCIFINWEEYKA